MLPSTKGKHCATFAVECPCPHATPSSVRVEVLTGRGDERTTPS
jgi:hypothetical protein